VTGVQTCALPISEPGPLPEAKPAKEPEPATVTPPEPAEKRSAPRTQSTLFDGF